MMVGEQGSELILGGAFVATPSDVDQCGQTVWDCRPRRWSWRYWRWRWQLWRSAL